MFRYLSKSIVLLLFSVVICCVIYPCVVWVIGQVFFPFQANGSLVKGPDGTVVGSRLIAQPFTKDEYFQPRPSAASYDASASAATQTGADGKPETFIQPVKEGSDIQSNFFDMWRQEHSEADLQDVPGDLVMASGSGLDPDITLENAEFQLERVAAKWADDTKRDAAVTRKEIEQILQANASAPFGGLAGEKFVNEIGRGHV